MITVKKLNVNSHYYFCKLLSSFLHFVSEAALPTCDKHEIKNLLYNASIYHAIELWIQNIVETTVGSELHFKDLCEQYLKFSLKIDKRRGIFRSGRDVNYFSWPKLVYSSSYHRLKKLIKSWINEHKLIFWVFEVRKFSRFPLYAWKGKTTLEEYLISMWPWFE